MAGISQTINNFHAGISQQPDQKKLPGQVKDIINGIPDVTEGLYKRPGTKRIDTSLVSDGDRSHSTATGQLHGVQSGGSWFHYFRDETEGSYIGQVEANGSLRVWRCSDGQRMDVAYGTGGETAIKAYLTPSTVNGVVQTEDIQALTINDTTFLNNRTKTVGTTGTTTAREHSHFAFIDLLRTENGRQYGLNIFTTETSSTLARATRLKIKSDNLAEGSNTGHCPGIGTQVFSVNSGTKKNLIFRITTLGQQGRSPGSNDGEGSAEYACSYSRQVTLLHGGEGWTTGDEVTVTLDQAQTDYTYTIRVEDHEDVGVKGTIYGGLTGIIRPAPTPFDADTAVTVDTILGGINTELTGTGVSGQIIGTGIYLHSASAFSVEVVNKDLMRVMQETVNDVSELPTQCKDGYIVKVSNSAASDLDDYYLKFNGNDNLDGPGSWEECAAPGIVKSLDAGTMPHVLQRQTDGSFLVKEYTWADRTVGDDTTNELPSFVNKKINRVLFFRNRLALLSDSNVILSRPGDLTTPSFFAKTALSVSAIDPIDITSNSIFPSTLFDGVETAAGLIVFSTNQQFLLASDDTVLNPDTAKLRTISSFNYNKDLPPISLGTTVGYVDNSGKFSRFNEMANIQREGEPVVVEMSKLISNLLPKDIDLLTNSRENQLILFGKTNTDIVYGFRYFTAGEERKQLAWFKWKLNNPIKYHFIINDEYFILDSDNFLQKMSIMQSSTDPSITQNSVDYLIHLDNWTTVGNGSYNASTAITTFANQSDWIDQVTSPNGDLVVVDTDTDSTRIGRYAKCTVINGDDFTVPGNWQYSQEWQFAPSDVNISNEQITLTAHGLDTAEPVRFQYGDANIAGLNGNTVYYIIKVDDNTVKLATNASNANAGTAINLTNEGGGTHKFQRECTLYIGYLYEYKVHFPTIYPLKVQGNQSAADVNSSLVLHRVKFNFGESGLYTTTLQRVAPKPDYSQTYESATLDEYNVSDAPYVAEKEQTVPVYEKNTNVEVLLKSSHPAPATLHSMSWEGDYTNKNYKRA